MNVGGSDFFLTYVYLASRLIADGILSLLP